MKRFNGEQIKKIIPQMLTLNCLHSLATEIECQYHNIIFN